MIPDEESVNNVKEKLKNDLELIPVYTGIFLASFVEYV